MASLSPNIKKAINLASKLHLGQVRKDDAALPFIRHPFSVAWILKCYTDDENVIIAGILHDTLEDAEGFKFKDLKKQFGPKIAKIVQDVTEKKSLSKKIGARASWKSRKMKFIQTLKKTSIESLLVSAADKIDNLESLYEAYKRQGEKLWDNFNAPVEKQLWYYESMARAIKARLNNPITQELDQALDKLTKLVKAKRKK